MTLAAPLLEAGGGGDDAGSSSFAAEKPAISAHFLHAAQQQLRMQHQELLRSMAAQSHTDMPPLPTLADNIAAATQLAAFLQSVHELQTHASVPPSLQLAEWERSVLPHILMIDTVDVQLVEAEEQKKRQAAEDDRAGRTRQFIDKLQQLTAIEQQQLLSISQHFAGIAQQLAGRERAMDDAAMRMREKQKLATSKLHNRLAAIVEEQKRAMADSYGRLHRSGDLSLAAVQSSVRSTLSLSSLQAVMQSFATTGAPRVLSVKVNALRAIKDKLPAGQYSLLVTVLPSIASSPSPAPLRALRLRRLPMSHKSESVWVRHFDWTRVPARHSGKHHACELNFTADEDELFIAAPAVQHTTLGACLLMQLIAISAQDEQPRSTEKVKGASAPPAVSGKRERLNLSNNTKPVQHTYERYYRTDAIVAFGYLPLVQPHTGALVDGKLKLPMLRGDPRIDSTVTAHSHIQQRIAQSLDSWLCNAYVDVAEVSGRWRDGYWVVDGDAAEKQRKRQRDEARRQEERRQQLIDTKAKQMLRNEQQSAGWLGFMNSIKQQSKPATAATANAADSDGSIANKIDLIGRSIEGMELSAEGKQLHKRQQMRQRVKQLQQYRQSVIVNNHTNITRIRPQHYTRMLLAFIAHATWQDLRYKPGQALYAAMNVLLLCGTWFLCHAIHYASQFWTLVSVLNLSVYEVDIRYPLTVTFHFDDYDNSSMESSSLAGPQLLVCAIGPFGCYLFLAFLALLTSLLSRCLPLPALFYSTTLFLCVHSLLDPLYVALIDVLSGHWQYNEYRLLFDYYRQRQSPYVALLLTFALLLALLLFGSVVLVVYLLSLHHQSEYRDLFGRLYSTEAELPLPADPEVSVRLVRRVMKDAAEYRGSRGTTRRVMVDEYINVSQQQPAEADGEVRPNLTEDEDKCIHVSIFNVTKRKTVARDRTAYQPGANEAKQETDDGDKDGIDDQSAADEQRLAQEQQDREQAVRESGKEDKELYRHFVRLTDGTWIECLDGVESYGGEEMSRREKEWLLQREKDDRGGEEEEERLREQREAEEKEAERLHRDQQRKEQQRKEEEETAKGRVRSTPLLRSAASKGGPIDGKEEHKRGSLREGRVLQRDEEKEQSDASHRSSAFSVSITAASSSDSKTAEADNSQPDPFTLLSPAGRGPVMGRSERMPSLLTTAIAENDDEEDEDD